MRGSYTAENSIYITYKKRPTLAFFAKIKIVHCAVFEYGGLYIYVTRKESRAAAAAEHVYTRGTSNNGIYSGTFKGPRRETWALCRRAYIHIYKYIPSRRTYLRDRFCYKHSRCCSCVYIRARALSRRYVCIHDEFISLLISYFSSFISIVVIHCYTYIPADSSHWWWYTHKVKTRSNSDPTYI